MEFSGFVCKKKLSKFNNKETIVISCIDHDYILRIQDKRKFAKEELLKMINKNIKIDGMLLGNILIINSWKLL